VRARSAVLLAGGVGYSLVAASTTPFTLPADVLTGLAIVVMAVLVGVRWPLRPRRARAISASSSSSSTTSRPYLLWVLLLVIFVAWELFNYLVHGTRANHPTFSSITDAIDRFYLLKALLFLGWLAAALVIVRRGSRAGLRSRSRPG
jgi:ABC-type dipeptide/oligopeptide/nickel transport system permease component